MCVCANMIGVSLFYIFYDISIEYLLFEISQLLTFKIFHGIYPS